MVNPSFNNQQPPVQRLINENQYQPPPRPKQPWLFEDQIKANIRGTYLLMALFIVLLTGIVFAVGEIYAPPYAITLAVIAAIVTFFTSYYSYYNSDKLVLSMSHARPATKEEFPFLINTLEGLCLAAGMPDVPKAYIIDDSAPNAFATGRDPQHAAIAVTTGLLEKLNRYQLEGVLAHELSHVADRDILLSTVAAVMVGTIVLLSDWVMRSMWYGGGRRRRDDREGGNGIMMIIALIAIILAPIIATLLQLALSRRREYLADAHAIKLTRYPDGLSGALEVIANDHEPLEVANKATAHLYIANPLEDQQGMAWLNNLFSTHPPIVERIARLRAM
ncbi:MAG: M48 family metalloprotease [Armatimonadota bacterium]